MFDFNPSLYADHFAREGYVHIRQGVTQDFYEKTVAQELQAAVPLIGRRAASPDAASSNWSPHPTDTNRA